LRCEKTRIDPVSGALPTGSKTPREPTVSSLAARIAARTTVAGSAKAGRQYRKNDAESNPTKIPA
jgi:hypothetical protein